MSTKPKKPLRVQRETRETPGDPPPEALARTLLAGVRKHLAGGKKPPETRPPIIVRRGDLLRVLPADSPIRRALDAPADPPPPIFVPIPGIELAAELEAIVAPPKAPPAEPPAKKK